MKFITYFKKRRVHHVMACIAGFLIWLALVAWLPGKGGSVVCQFGLAAAFYAYCQWAYDSTGRPSQDFRFRSLTEFTFKFDARTTYLIAKAEQQRTLLRSSQKSADDGNELLRTAQEMETDPQELLRSK